MTTDDHLEKGELILIEPREPRCQVGDDISWLDPNTGLGGVGKGVAVSPSMCPAVRVQLSDQPVRMTTVDESWIKARMVAGDQVQRDQQRSGQGVEELPTGAGGAEDAGVASENCGRILSSSGAF